MAEFDIKAFLALPQAESCRTISFEDADVRPGIVNDTWFLIVSGFAPYLNMQVNLVPLVYITQPEYWTIEVVGCLPGIGLPTEDPCPYIVAIPLDGITGTKGIEVKGGRRSERIDVPPK
jgi:hypothetical protein